MNVVAYVGHVSENVQCGLTEFDTLNSIVLYAT